MKPIQEFNLSDNPFQNITPILGEQSEQTTPWAGMTRLHDNLKKVYASLYEHKSRQVVLNWGPYGGGKTFAAYHFLQQVPPESIELEQIYVRCPKVGKSGNEELYSSIISTISIRRIRKQIQRLLLLMGDDNAFEFLNRRLRNEEIVSAILKLSSNEDDVVSLMNRYVYSALSGSELKRVGLSKNIEWGTDSIKFLAGILLCFIGDQQSVTGRVVLWIDEMEDMIYYSQKEYHAFSQVLRDLIDHLNQYVLVIFNFTLAESEEQTIELMLGGALWDRIDKKIRFVELNHEDALLYCKDLISHYQIDKLKGALHPFDENTVGMVLSLIPNGKLTPRTINRYFKRIIEYAQENEAIAIDAELIAKCLENVSEE